MAPNEGATQATAGLVVRRDEVEPISWSGGESGRWLLNASDTEGRFSLYEVVVPAGQGSHFHIHQDMDETFYILSGEFEVTIEQQVHRAVAGTLVYGPRGLGHSFRNVGDTAGTMLCITTPGGIENFFEELSRLIRREPPAPWELFAQLAARHRIIAYPPGVASAAEARNGGEIGDH
jgi:quercetin dioxygenase-like cupin family protein